MVVKVVLINTLLVRIYSLVILVGRLGGLSVTERGSSGQGSIGLQGLTHLIRLLHKHIVILGKDSLRTLVQLPLSHLLHPFRRVFRDYILELICQVVKKVDLHLDV